MNYFKKIIKKWKLIYSLNQRKDIVASIYNISISGCSRQMATVSRRKTYRYIFVELRAEYFAIKKALNKLHSL